MSHSLFQFIAGPLAALALVAGTASAQDVTINLGYAASETSTYACLPTSSRSWSSNIPRAAST
jgi:hypothetical protein